MAREATGELRPLLDGWEARIRLDGESRRGFQLHGFKRAQQAEARERCAALSALARRLRGVASTADVVKLLEVGARAKPGRPWEAVQAAVDALCAGTAKAVDSTVPTVGDFLDSWTSGKLAARHPDHIRPKDSRRDAEIGRLYVKPVIGSLRLNEVTLSDAELVMANLPKELEPGSRRHVAQVLHRLMVMAVYPGRHIAVSPIPKGWLPSTGDAKARSYLYPDEDAKLLSCKAVPLAHRILWGFMDREGTRGPSEALAFRWRHFDLERGAVRLDRNKTKKPRAWALSPGVVRALKAWKALSPGGTEPDDRVFVDAKGNQFNGILLATYLRADLKKAGVSRPELFEHNDVRLQIRAHDLRATFITLSLANGKTEAWVRARSGHTTSGQLVNYQRDAETVEELGLGDLSPLDQAIPEFLTHERPTGGRTRDDSGDLAPANGAGIASSAEITSEGWSFGSAYRGSNPCAGTHSWPNRGPYR